MVKHLQFAFIFFITALLVTTANAQKWYEMTLQDHVKIEDVKQEAERYFSVVGTGPHTGYKGYNRWLYSATLHMDKNGYLYSSDHLLKEKQKFNRNAPKQRNTDIEGNWSAVGPFNVTRGNSRTKGIGRVVSIAVEPIDQQLVFVGSPGGGIWRSNDAGASWEPKGDDLEDMYIWAIGIDPNNSNHILHLNSGSNLLESFDQGESWNKVKDLGSYIGRPGMIKFHPTNSDIYFVSQGWGLFKTVDGGVSFTEVIEEALQDVFFKPGDINTMYACGHDFFKSTDLGTTWTKITDGITASERMKMTVTSADPNRVYIIQKSGSGFGRIYESIDAGNSFQINADIDNGAPNYIGRQAARDMAIMCSNSNPDELHIAGLNNYRSQNRGETFALLSNWNAYTNPAFIHADVEVMINVNETLYAGTDGGIYRSTDAGDSYTSLAMNGLAISQFYRIGSTAPYPGTGIGLDPDMLLAGAQDNGTLITKNSTHDWQGWIGADGMECFIDYTNDDIVYGTFQNGTLLTSTDGGASFSGLDEPEAGGSWITPFEMDPKVHTTLYVGYKELYKSVNSGKDWEPITSGESEDSKIDEIAIAPSDNNYIYFAESDRLWVSTNAQSSSRTWNQVSGISGTINYIAVDPNDPTHVVIANIGSGLYETKDAGSTWSEIIDNLPKIGTTCVLMDNTEDNGIYVGMAQGVYYKDDTMSEWELFGNGLPNCDVSELEINYQANKLRIATFGRGVWEIGIFETKEDITPQITVETKEEKCLGDTIVLSVQNDPSWVAPINYQWYKDGGLIAGATNSNYDAQEDGNYSAKVITNDAFGTSEAKVVDFIALPITPSVTVEQICGAGTVTLTATGSGDGIIKWYSDEEGDNELAEGDTYNVGISQTSSFYVKEISKNTACSSLSNEALAIVITPLDAPNVTDQIICTTGEIILTATTSEDGTIRWYSQENPDEVIGTGDSFVTNVENTSTFLADVAPRSSVQKGGFSLDGATGSNSGGNYGLQFDVFEEMTLLAVQVKAQGEGERTLELFNASGDLIWTKEVDLVDGIQRVELNLELEPGEDYKLGAPNGSNLFRSIDGFVYPMEIEDLLSIKGYHRYGSGSVNTSTYFYFYDWEVTVPEEGCASDKVSLTVTLDNCTGLSDYENENLTVYPNPSSGIINLKLPKGFDLKAIEVTDIRGNTFFAYGEYVEQIDVQGLESGIYLVKVTGEQGIKVFKIKIQ